MESKEATKKLQQTVKRVGGAMIPDNSPSNHVIFWIDLKELPPDEKDPDSHGLQLRVAACPDVTAEDEMGRRLRAALRVALEGVLAELGEDTEMEQTMEAADA